jgi:hypothetical protein
MTCLSISKGILPLDSSLTSDKRCKKIEPWINFGDQDVIKKNRHTNEFKEKGLSQQYIKRGSPQQACGSSLHSNKTISKERSKNQDSASCVQTIRTAPHFSQ